MIFRCLFCKQRASNSKRMNDKPKDYRFICHTCRQIPTPDEYRCIYINKKGKQCGHWKGYRIEKCAFHNRGEFK